MYRCNMRLVGMGTRCMRNLSAPKCSCGSEWRKKGSRQKSTLYVHPCKSINLILIYVCFLVYDYYFYRSYLWDI